MSKPLSFFVNSESHACSEGDSLWQVMEGLKYTQQQGIAVAVNNQVISKSKWTEYNMQMNDEIIVVTAAQGG